MKRFEIGSDGLTLSLSTYGASALQLQYQRFPFSVLCGLPDRLYPTHAQHFGAIAGPVANRIANATAMLAGSALSFEANEGQNCLHSGSNGLGRREWDLAQHTENSALLSIEQADGEGGFPGNRVFTAEYILSEDSQHNTHQLEVVLGMQSDMPTYCNMAFHPYFCLDGTGSILAHELAIAAYGYLETNSEKLPTGRILDLADSKFDFSVPQPLKMLAEPDRDVLDHHFCLHSAEQQPPRFEYQTMTAARLYSPVSGISMAVETNQRGLQIYCPRRLPDELVNRDNTPFQAFPSICIEPHMWPDAPNHENFPSILVTPETAYLNRSVFRFSADSLSANQA